jgi:1-phosphatidylinositol phosphodiesterase
MPTASTDPHPVYHGPRPQRSSLAVLLSALHDFLSAHPTETLVMSIKEESPPFHPRFSALVYQAFRPYEDKFWFLEERVPTLGEVRGKGLLMTRFDLNEGDEGWPNGMGLHPYTWPDSRKEGFEWNCAGTTVRTQDWCVGPSCCRAFKAAGSVDGWIAESARYRVKTFLSIPEKYDVLIDHLLPTLTASANPTLTLSFSSASYFPLSCPTTIAKGFGWPSWGLGIEGMNSRLTRWLLERVVGGEQVRACVPMDFYRQEGWPGEILVLMNFLDKGKENS